MFPVMCRMHPQHCEECGVCRGFDAALKKHLASYTTPPQHHISVTGPQVRAWADSIFPVPSES